MGRFYETSSTPTVDYSSEFPFEELFLAHKYTQDRNDKAMENLGTGWDNLLKVGYIPGGEDEQTVKDARSQFENLYRSASEKGNLSQNYNWLQKEIAMISRNPALIDIHRSYEGNNAKVKNDQALKTNGQYKDQYATNPLGWSTRERGVFGSDPGHFTTPWLDWKPSAKAYFDNMEDETKQGEQGKNYILQHAANNASDFANKPEGDQAITEAIQDGTLTQGLDQKDPNFRNQVAQRILENEGMEIWKKEQIIDPNAKKKNNNSTTTTPISTTSNPYVTLLEDIYKPEFTGELNQYSGKPEVNMINGVQALPEQIDEILGTTIQTDKATGQTYRSITLGKDLYLDLGNYGESSYYTWDPKTASYSATTGTNASPYEKERQSYDLKLLDQFYSQGYIQEQLSALTFDAIKHITSPDGQLELKAYILENPGSDSNEYMTYWKLQQLNKTGDPSQLLQARQLLLNNGVNPMDPKNIKLHALHKKTLNEAGESELTHGIVSKLQHSMQGLNGTTIRFESNVTDKNVFMTRGFNADGSESNRLAVRGFAIMTEDQLEAAFKQDASGWTSNDWVDQLVDNAGIIQVHVAGNAVFNGDATTYKVPMYLPVDMSHSRMQNYNEGKISSSEGSDEKDRARKNDFNNMVNFNAAGNSSQMQNKALNNRKENTERQMGAYVKGKATDKVLERLDGIEATISGFANESTKNLATAELNDIKEALTIHQYKANELNYTASTLASRKKEVMDKYPTLESAIEGYAELSTKLRSQSWNYQELDSEAIESNYKASSMLVATDEFNVQTGLVKSSGGEEYINITKPGSQIVTNPVLYKEIAAKEAQSKGYVSITGENSAITSTNLTVGSTVFSPYLTEASAATFDALLGLADAKGINVTLTGAHRTEAYNTALSTKLQKGSRGYHTHGQACDLAPNAGLLKLLTNMSKADKQSLGIRGFIEEDKGSKNHHIHIEFMR